jgi:hypothetical protein
MTNPTEGVKVLLCGDLHGNWRSLQQAFSQAFHRGCEAIVQVGDFGFGWALDEEGRCAFSMRASEYAQESGVHLYWIDGNHENFDLLDTMPRDENGHVQIAPGVTYLSRGSNLVIGNTTFRAFGGAYSVDVGYRTIHKSWWPQETVTDEDVQRSIDNGPADIFLSHDAPTGVQDTAGLRRKLSEWGPVAAERSMENQRRVRAALDASGAQTAYHGHLHQSYACFLDNGVRVQGLNRDDDFGQFEFITVQ